MPLETIAVLLPLPAAALAKIRTTFKTVHYHPDWTLPAAIRPTVEIIFTSGRGIPHDVKLDQVPKLKHVQLASAGADTASVCPTVRELRDLSPNVEDRPFAVSTASGTHVLSIPNWIVGSTIILYHQLQSALTIARDQARWASGTEVDLRGETYFARSTHGRTAGLLGYGALGRESARLLKAHGMRVIAANTSGKPTSETEYVIPGTGDLDGSIPDKFYSTKDAESFDEFLRQTDVLVCSLPNTPATRFLLNADKLALLRKDALFINVGRGSLIRSEDLLTALNRPDGLFGAAIDVTDPEPLTQGHALWTHPRCIVTPHISGDTEGEMEIATDIAIANADRVGRSLKPYNIVDLEKGY